MPETPRDIVDLVARDLARAAPEGFIHLAGIPVKPSLIRAEDISVILPELQADKVLVVGEPSPWAFYTEFQKKPADEETMEAWPVKLIALKRRLRMPVSLVVFYLHRGDRATFPDYLLLGRSPLQSRFEFPIVRLWEKEDEIRQKYPALAPLLLVTAEEPDEDRLREVKALIDGIEEPDEKRDNLYGLTAMLAMHYFEGSLVRAVFGPQFEEIKKMGVIDRWLDEKYNEGINEGRNQGINEGRNQGARQVALGLLAKKFGALPASVTERVQAAHADWCRQLTEQLLTAQSLEELDLS